MAAKAKAKLKKAAVRVKATARKATKKVAAKVKKARVAPIPKGYTTATPFLTIRGANEALEFYKRAFGAKLRGAPMMMPDGKVAHAEIKIGDSIVMMGEEMPEMGSKSPQSLGGSGSGVMLYVKNCDAVFNQAVSAGAKVLQPLADQFWGDRYGKIEDPFGHQWSIGTHVEDVTARQMAKRMAAMGQQG